MTDNCNYRYRPTGLIAGFFESKGFDYYVKTDDDKEIIISEFGTENAPPVIIKIYIRRDANDVAIRCFSIMGDMDDDKRDRAIAAANILNSKIRFSKFVVDSDGDFSAQYDLPENVSDDLVGEACLEIIGCMTTVISRYFSFIARAVYTDEPIDYSDVGSERILDFIRAMMRSKPDDDDDQLEYADDDDLLAGFVDDNNDEFSTDDD